MSKKALVTVIAVVAAAGFLMAKTAFTPMSGYAMMTGPPTGGEVSCVGGAPTGVWPPCSAGAKTKIRGMQIQYWQEARKPDGSVDPLHTGFRDLVMNANFDENGKGHAWGTWRLVTSSGQGEWVGTFSGEAERWFGPAVSHVVGRGLDGDVAGMQLRAIVSYLTFPLDPATGLPGQEKIEGYRFDPGAK